MPEGTDGDSVSFILLYGMAEEAGNEYMNTSFSADVTILATQYTYEEDSFGPDYDKDATYPVTSTADLKTALSNGGIAVLANDVSVKPEGEDDGLVPQMKVTEDTILDISGYTLGVAYSEVDDFSYTPALISVDSGTLTIDGDGVITAEAGNNNSYGIDVNGGDLVINGGSYYGALTAIQVTQGSLIINDGFFDLAPTCKAAVPVSYAKYVVNAIDRYYKDGTAVIEIKGGTFVNFDPSANPEGDGTSYVADGYKVVSETQTNGEIWYTVVAE